MSSTDDVCTNVCVCKLLTQQGKHWWGNSNYLLEPRVITNYLLEPRVTTKMSTCLIKPTVSNAGPNQNYEFRIKPLKFNNELNIY